MRGPPILRMQLFWRTGFGSSRDDPKRYGTQLDWDADGNLSPGEVEEPERLDDRRLAAGLPSLSKQTEEARNRAMAEGERAPVDHKAYLSARDEWARRVGWRTR